MTQEEFLVTAEQLTYSVNVWYSTEQPYTVLGVTIPITDAVSLVDISRYLQQVEVLTVQVNEGQFLSLEVVSRSLLGSTPKQYYFFKVKEATIEDTGDQNVPNSKVYLSPGIQGSDYTNSPYNIVQGTAEIPRQSDYLMQSDRASGTLRIVGGGLPTNIDNLQSGSATKAYVQDSLYSDTGWTRARYDGTPTTRLTYGGIDPAIQGNVFKGSYFTRTTLDSRILSQSDTDLVYTDYLFTGTQEIPQYTTQYISSSLSTFINSINQTSITINLGSSNAKSNIEIGDLLKFSDSSGSINFPEIVKVSRILSRTSTQMQLVVTRGWDQTVKGTYTTSPDPDTYLHKITPVQIFKLFGNKIQAESRGKVKVQQTGDLMYIDSLGFIVTGSLN